MTLRVYTDVMELRDIQVVLEELVETVALLCQETAGLVDDYSTRLPSNSVRPDEVRLKADKLRLAARSLRAVLTEAQTRGS